MKYPISGNEWEKFQELHKKYIDEKQKIEDLILKKYGEDTDLFQVNETGEDYVDIISNSSHNSFEKFKRICDQFDKENKQ